MICNVIRPSLGLLVVLCVGLLSCGKDAPPGDDISRLRVVHDDPSDLPLQDLSRSWRERFLAGDAGFEQLFRESEGLGPLYIRPACAACHTKDSKGPGAVFKMVRVANDGATPLADQGGIKWGPTIRPLLAAGATQPVLSPTADAAVKVSRRVGPAVFGRGYMEAIEDREIMAQEEAQRFRTDGIHGHVNWVSRVSETNPDATFHSFQHGEGPLVGRFGVKGRLATVDDFVADAYQGDMGLTSPLRPDELPNPEGLTDDLKPGIDLELETVNVVSDYVRLIKIPERNLPAGPGAALFAQVHCSVCHVPEMITRRDYPVPQLAGIMAPVYSDMLVHDMGSELADGMVEFSANGREWRTAPLMGLRHMAAYLHDGRAGTVQEAIAMHAGPGSEANASVAAFAALSAAERAALLAFVEAL